MTEPKPPEYHDEGFPDAPLQLVQGSYLSTLEGLVKDCFFFGRGATLPLRSCAYTIRALEARLADALHTIGIYEATGPLVALRVERDAALARIADLERAGEYAGEAIERKTDELQKLYEANNAALAENARMMIALERIEGWSDSDEDAEGFPQGLYNLVKDTIAVTSPNPVLAENARMKEALRKIQLLLLDNLGETK